MKTIKYALAYACLAASWWYLIGWPTSNGLSGGFGIKAVVYLGCQIHPEECK